ncbi:MAG: DUF4292 domain-containing protein [Bacteroidales bacterium]
MQKIIALLLVLVAFSTGCSTLRKSESSDLKADGRSLDSDFAGSISENNISSANFFIRKAEITVTSKKGMDRFTASIRFKKPDSLLISVRSKIGIEAARGLLTRDTVLINDRVDKKLLTGNTKILKVKYGVEPSILFALLGDFIIDEKDQKRIVKCQNGTYSDSFIINDRRVDYKVDCKRKKVTGAYFEGSLTTGNITLVYSSFKSMDGLLVPREIEMREDMNDLKINMKIDNAEIGWNGNIEFIPGNGYDVIFLK